MRLIDADALKDVIGISKRLGNKAISYYIDTMPTIESEPVRHGHWTLNSMEHGVCSVCHQSSVDIVGGDWSNYCPACGAKMDEVNNEVN